jgi:hypothetical protein
MPDEIVDRSPPFFAMVLILQLNSTPSLRSPYTTLRSPASNATLLKYFTKCYSLFVIALNLKLRPQFFSSSAQYCTQPQRATGGNILPIKSSRFPDRVCRCSSLATRFPVLRVCPGVRCSACVAFGGPMARSKHLAFNVFEGPTLCLHVHRSGHSSNGRKSCLISMFGGLSCQCFH